VLVSDQDIDVAYRSLGWIGIDGVAQVGAFEHQVFNVGLLKSVMGVL